MRQSKIKVTFREELPQAESNSKQTYLKNYLTENSGESLLSKLSKKLGWNRVNNITLLSAKNALVGCIFNCIKLF